MFADEQFNVRRSYIIHFTLSEKYVFKEEDSSAIINSMSFKYENLKKRQKGLQRGLSRRIFNDIHSIQQLLEAMEKQNQQSVGLQNNIRQKTDNEEDAVNDIVSLRSAENASNTDYKIKADHYASLLMYNSY